MSHPPQRDASSRDKILEVAEALYARRGFAGVGMREVAEAAGLGKSSLFHHFRSKVQLYLAVHERVLGRLDDRLSAVLASDASPGEKLDRWVDAAIDVFAEQPSSARILLRALVEENAFESEEWPEGQAVDSRLVS
ncbi:MAG: TetR/AcrR family transcriptional regulator, partial [Myxococcota bacterium]|nr:TetR/AcrR family transcriptional regulator [Myxococcota bacterium]